MIRCFELSLILLLAQPTIWLKPGGYWPIRFKEIVINDCMINFKRTPAALLLHLLFEPRWVSCSVWILHRYLKVNFEDFELHELDCKFDVILVEPPLEEYQRQAAGATFNWKPWSWEEVRTGSPLSVHECYRLFVPLVPTLLIVCTPGRP